MGKNADGSLTLDNGNTGLRVTEVAGDGPTPIETTTPPPGSATEIGDTPPVNGPTPIGDQGTLPSSPPGTVAVGKNADGSLTLDNGDTGLRVTEVAGDGPTPIETTTPPPGSATEIGDTPPVNGPTPIGDQGTLPSSPPGTVAVGKNADGSLTLDNGDTGLRVTEVAGDGPTPIETTTPPPGSATEIGDTPLTNGPQPIAGPTTPTGAAGDPADGAGTPTDSEPPTGGDASTSEGGGQGPAVNPDGTTNVSSSLPPPSGGLSTGPGATDPNDPQQGQQPIGYTHQDLSPFSADGSIGSTSSVSDMPNTAHIESPSSGVAGTPGPYKRPTP